MVGERGMFGGFDAVQLVRGMDSHFVSGTPQSLYSCESQGGPLRIFAHDLDWTFCTVAEVLEPVHL